MNPDEESERAMPSTMDAGLSSDAAAPGAAGEGAPRPGVTDVQAYIGRQLRAVYDDVVKQPIPDRFLALMKRLEDGAGQG